MALCLAGRQPTGTRSQSAKSQPQFRGGPLLVQCPPPMRRAGKMTAPAVVVTSGDSKPAAQCDSVQALHFGRTIFLPQPQSPPTTNEISERESHLHLPPGWGQRRITSRPSPPLPRLPGPAAFPESLHGDPLSHPARRSLGPALRCCLPRKLCWSGARGRRPAMPMSTSPTSPTAGVTGSASGPSSTHTGPPEGEQTRRSQPLSLPPGGPHH